ncbi:MAG: helix-turn-helix transcriptional regulator [Thaumarchaeota archaeon]|nr:helix-turn-helix transcriptional regulator [Nitrososphaerota archaeon]
MESDDDILSVLGDRYSREIIILLKGNEMTTQEIAAKLGMPASTAYRKIKFLEYMNMIKKTKVVRTLEGLDERYYRGLVSEIEIRFKDGKISYKIERIKMDDKIVRLWQKFGEK